MRVPKGPPPRDLSFPPVFLANERPVILTLDRSIVRIASARLVGADTDLEATGTITAQEKAAMDLRVNGTLNLTVLQAFDSDLASTGKLQISTSVRGPLDQPQVNGRAEFQKASLNLVDFPNGLSNISGTLLFSGTRATVESFHAESGGGKISASGFVGYDGELSYRLQAKATGVRVRYPEGVSTTANADVVLNGTSARSLMQGTVTILRTGFNPRTDLSSILSKSAEPVKTPAVRTGPLSNMQLDVKIETAPDISFESALAQDIQAEASLRLQGTIYNPALLGRVSVTQGDITFFGTKYTISEGTISFLNPVKVEPVLDLDLETRVRGIDVTLTFTGPLNKLTITHRSDPPLEFSEIVALLATGAPPTSDPALAARQSAQPQSFNQLGASALIGQVVANPLSSRLQRFFGVSRLKIDPQLTGVENNPQARLTLEQQVSKDLTFTYITNLTNANQQVVRIEWALNKNWSILAVREENGLFGMDILYKKRFK